MKKLLWCFAAVFVLNTSKPARGQIKTKLFELISPAHSGISFINKINESDSLNVFNYEYLYNGAGIGAADFNNDGLVDLFFSGNMVSNKLYLNRGHFKFEDVTKKARLNGNGTWSTGVSIADVNADGLPDIYVCHSGKFYDDADLRNELYINKGVNVKTGVPVFEEMAAAYKIDAPGTQTTQAAFFDYDKDGDLDMFMLNHSNHSYNPFLNTKKQRSTPNLKFGNRLFRQDKNADGTISFTDVTFAAGIVNNALNFGLNISISDINQDGWPDIYTTSDYTEQDYYYVNNHNGTFTQSLQQSFSHISKYSMGSDIADVNNDGLFDVITLDMLPEDNHRQKLLRGADEYDQYHLLLDSGYFHQQMRNMLQLNRGRDAKGNTRFSEVGQLSGISNTDWSWSPLLADFDNDGWKDLLVTNGYLRDYTDLDFLKYTVADEQMKQMKAGNLNYKTYDLVKKMPSQKLTNYIFKNKGDLTFSNQTKDWGLDQLTVSNSAVYADLDNDGDLDIIVGNNNETPLVLKNKLNETAQNNYIKIALQSKSANTAAIGAKVIIYAKNSIQYLENFPVRGYQSSMNTPIHAGLSSNQIDSIKVIWPGNHCSLKKNPAANQLISFTEEELSGLVASPTYASKGRLIEDVTKNSGINFIHKENDFVDFKDEPLLPYQLSRMGPALAKADVNNDHLEDIFIGGAIGQSGKLYTQNSDGSFAESKSQPWEIDKESEDVNAIFFDADNDGFQDLYVVSGGNEYDDGSPEYQDRLYLNDGKGAFRKTLNALPGMTSSKQAIAVADIDADGDIDIFVGGFCTPGSYPFPAKSYILKNISQQGLVRFENISLSLNNQIENIGMVQAASWADLNRDGYPELLIGGDWMPLKLYSNQKGSKLNDISAGAGLGDTNGLWASLLIADVDKDGDLDIVAGNCGQNNQFNASKEKPMDLYASDFDNNGRIDAVLCYYIGDKSYPLASRDELLDQVVSLKKKFLTYKDYADAGIETIFSTKQIEKATKYQCKETRSIIFINDGSNNFSAVSLPKESQFSRVSSIILDKIAGTEKILLTGNFYPNKNQLGMSDAGLGCLLEYTRSQVNVVPNESINLFINGDVRKSVLLKNSKEEQMIISATNDGPVQVLKLRIP